LNLSREKQSITIVEIQSIKTKEVTVIDDARCGGFFGGG